jgi:hypothetical protein
MTVCDLRGICRFCAALRAMISNLDKENPDETEVQHV